MIDRKHRNDPVAYLILADLAEDEGRTHEAAELRRQGNILAAALTLLADVAAPSNFRQTPEGWIVEIRCCECIIKLSIYHDEKPKPRGCRHLYRQVKGPWLDYVCRRVRESWCDYRL